MASYDASDADTIDGLLQFPVSKRNHAGKMTYVNRRAQEEVILYNSDGYRALLDLKYGRMGGGYAIPEFGLAYVRDIRFFCEDTDECRLADMMVSACYCMTSAELYPNPRTTDEQGL
ncbi:unnamed protein product [Rotaria sp. Silwood1]|nr:unnamed protein product [Rotaria sp. Silwood1]